MFLHHCDHCGRRELRGPRSLFTDDAGTFVAACRICGTVSPILRTAPAAATAERTTDERTPALAGPRVASAA